MESKTFWKSRTIWFNALTVVTAAASYYFGYESNPQLVEMTTELLVIVNPLVNLALRGVTRSAISR